jgi:hypothetical protein
MQITDDNWLYWGGAAPGSRRQVSIARCHLHWFAATLPRFGDNMLYFVLILMPVPSCRQASCVQHRAPHFEEIMGFSVTSCYVKLGFQCKRVDHKSWCRASRLVLTFNYWAGLTFPKVYKHQRYKVISVYQWSLTYRLWYLVPTCTKMTSSCARLSKFKDIGAISTHLYSYCIPRRYL